MARRRRVEIPQNSADLVLFLADQTCCICHDPSKRVQIHHLDEDPANNDLANLAVLCFDCHDKTQVTGGVGRQLSPGVVKRYRDHWLAVVAQRRTGEAGAGLPRSTEELRSSANGSEALPMLNRLAALPRPDIFVGRTMEAQVITQRLLSSETNRMLAVVGLPGIGKTTLVTAVAHRLLDQGAFRDGAVAVSCGGLLRAEDILRALLAEASHQRRGADASVRDTLADAIVEMFQDQDVLVVLDDVESSLPEAELSTLLRVLQPEDAQSGGIGLLVTARRIPSRRVVPVTATLSLDALEPDQAYDLFFRSYGHEMATSVTFSEAESSAVKRIVDALGRHPLAIRIAGAHAADARRDLNRLADELERDPLDIPDGDEVRALPELFARFVDALPPAARHLFAALGAFPSEEIGRVAALTLGRMAGLDRPQDGLQPLILRMLLQPRTDEGLPQGDHRERLRFHPLLYNYARSYLDRWPDEDRFSVRYAVACYYAAHLPNMVDDEIRLDAANVVGALRWAHDCCQHKLLIHLCHGMRLFWRDWGHTTSSLTYLPWGIEAAREELGEHLYDMQNAQLVDILADLLMQYGQALSMSEQLSDADRIFKECLDLYDARGNPHGQGVVLEDLGVIAMKLDKLDLAETYFVRARDILAAVNVPWECALAEVYLGHVALEHGDALRAEESYGRALPVLREYGNLRGESVVLHQLGQIAFMRNQPEDAERYLHSALDIFRSIHDRHGEGAVLGTLAMLAFIKKDLEAAQRLASDAVSIDRITRNVQAESSMQWLLSRLAQVSGQLDESKRYLTEADRVAASIPYTLRWQQVMPTEEPGS